MDNDVYGGSKIYHNVVGRIGIMNEWVHLVALEPAQDSGAIGTTQQERSSTVSALTLYPMDDHDDRPGRKIEPILAGLRPLFERHSGMVLVTGVAVSRQEYSGKTPKQEGSS